MFVCFDSNNPVIESANCCRFTNKEESRRKVRLPTDTEKLAWPLACENWLQFNDWDIIIAILITKHNWTIEFKFLLVKLNEDLTKSA